MFELNIQCNFCLRGKGLLSALTKDLPVFVDTFPLNGVLNQIMFLLGAFLLSLSSVSAVSLYFVV